MLQKRIIFIKLLLISIVLITSSVILFYHNHKIIVSPFTNRFNVFQNEHLNVHTSGNKKCSAQWLNNSDFSSQDSWFSLKGGDISDVNASIYSEQAHFEILGEKKKFSLIADPPLALDWNESDNPLYPNRPEYYSITTDGCKVSHLYNDQTAVTNPSIHWERNISLPVNMSD
ncbi:MAG: hypothetical protein ACFE9T_12590, partial [Promethearchaeota archaeon]